MGSTSEVYPFFYSIGTLNWLAKPCMIILGLLELKAFTWCGLLTYMVFLVFFSSNKKLHNQFKLQLVVTILSCIPLNLTTCSMLFPKAGVLELLGVSLISSASGLSFWILVSGVNDLLSLLASRLWAGLLSLIARWR